MPEGKEIAGCGLGIADWRGHRAWGMEHRVKDRGQTTDDRK